MSNTLNGKKPCLLIYLLLWQITLGFLLTYLLINISLNVNGCLKLDIRKMAWLKGTNLDFWLKNILKLKGLTTWILSLQLLNSLPFIVFFLLHLSIIGICINLMSIVPSCKKIFFRKSTWCCLLVIVVRGGEVFVSCESPLMVWSSLQGNGLISCPNLFLKLVLLSSRMTILFLLDKQLYSCYYLCMMIII